MGTATPASASRVTISGSAAAASSLFTVTRTNCEPAAASAATWSAVARASAVSVFVIDCTTIGCADPTGTEPTSAVTVVLRGAKGTAGWGGQGSSGNLSGRPLVRRRGAVVPFARYTTHA